MAMIFFTLITINLIGILTWRNTGKTEKTAQMKAVPVYSRIRRAKS